MCKIVVVMKSYRTIISLITALNLLTTVNLLAQATCTASASAVIMESVSISSKAVTEIAMNNNLLIKGDEAEVELGSIMIDSGNSGNFSFLIKPATVTSKSGNNFIITPKTDDLISDKTLSLKGSTSTKESQPSGLYKGSYTIVVFYN